MCLRNTVVAPFHDLSALIILLQIPLITVLKVNSDFSLHPASTGWKELFKSVLMVTGELSVTTLIPGTADLLM